MKLLSDDEFLGGSAAGGSTLLSDDEFMGSAAQPAEPPGFLSELKKGFVGSILNQNPQSLADALDAGAELTRPSPGTLVGSLVRPKGEPVGEFPSSRLGDAAATVRGWAQHGAEDRKASVPSFTDIRTDSLSHMFEDAASYAGYGIGSGAGSSTPSIVVGASVAAATKNPVGFFAGALGPSYAQNLGDTYATLRDDPGIQQAIKDGKLTQKRVAAIAAAVAVPIAALDAVSAEKMIGINLEELKGGIIKRVLKKVGIGSLTEGGTEGLQQVIQESALAAAGGDHTLAQSAVSVIDNAVQGALSGGAISTAAAPFGNKATDKAKGTPETGIPQGAASADTLFGQESAGGPPPPSADTAAGGPPPPPAATTVEKERPNSPRLTPADRASPLPNDLIDDGKKIFQEALGEQSKGDTPVSSAAKTAAPLDGQIITPAQQKEAARRVDDIAGEFGSQPAPSAIDHTIEGTLTPAEAASAPAPRLLSDEQFMASPTGASQAVEVQPAVVRIDGRDFPFTGYPEAVDAYRKTIDRSGAVPRSSIAAMRGASSAPEAQFVAADGKIVAHMGYNGKVWRHGDLGPDYSKPIYDPAETAEPAPEIKGEKLTSPAAPAQASWMQSLVGDEKDAVTEQMREMAAKAQKIYDTPLNRTPSGSVAAGSEGARQALKAGAIESVLRAIRQGKTPDEAIEIAKSETQQTIKAHNARSRDIHWKVDAEAFDSEIKHTAGMLRDALMIRDRATKTVKQPRSPSVENKDIVQFIAGMGGIRDYKGELRSLDLSKKFVPGMGKLVRESGSPADTVREAAAQEGYFDHIYGDPDTASQKSTIADLYRLIDDNERGNRRFTTAGQRAVEKKQADKAVVQDSEEQARQDDFAQTVKENGLDDEETAILQDAVDRGEWASEAVFDILERRAVAFEGETHDIRGQGEPNLDDIPFDIPQAPDTRSADAPREGSSDQGRDRQGADAGAAQGSAPPRGQHGQAERAGRSPEGGEGKGALKTETVDTQDGKREQTVLPGAERISQKTQAQREADKPLRPKAPQKDAGELFDSQARSERQDDMFSAKPPEPAPQQALKEKIQAKRAEAATAKIDDFGEKIAGARKDMVRDLADSLSSDIDIATEPLSKIFPQPDYEKLAEAGVNRASLAMIAVARQQIPSKPRVNYKVARWAEQVRVLRDFANKLLTGDSNPTALAERMRGTAYLRNVADTARLIEDLDPAVLPQAAKWSVKSGSYTRFMGYSGPSKTFYYLLDDNGRHVKDPSGATISGETFDDIVDPARAFLRATLGKEEPTAKRQTPTGIYQDRTTKTYFIGFKGQSGVIRLKAGFDTAQDARSYREEKAAELQAAIDEMRAGPQMRRPENRPREGVDRREGDVNPEQFQEAFGFRGVQFGNYVEGPRRQFELNEAFDGLIDLAEVIGVPPNALSLNGKLGLAFGARGHGNAKAHYEPSHVVINLTKPAGAGSLAHEWFHAVDDYFARQDTGGRASVDFMTTRGESTTGAVRPTVRQAFNSVRKSLLSGSYSARMQKLDDARSKIYWNTMIEKAARGFEKYVVDRLAAERATNDYLANIDENAGAYPTNAEMRDQGITAAFDDLFNAIETRDTPQGVEMFALRRRSTRRRSTAIDAFVDRVMAGENVNKPLVVGENPEVLESLGVGGKYLTVTSDVIDKATYGKHNLTAEEVKAALAAVYDPVMAFEHGANTGNVDLVTGTFDANGRPILVGVGERAAPGSRGALIISSIRTIHGKDDAGFAASWAEDGRLRYWDRDGVALWLSTVRANSSRLSGIVRDIGEAIRRAARLLTPSGNKILTPNDIFKGETKPRLRTNGTPDENLRLTRPNPADLPSSQTGMSRQGDEANVAPTDAFKQHAQDIGARLRTELDRLGLKDVGLRISENLGLMVDGNLHAADGSYFRKLISVALDADNPDSVLDHEAIHALRDVGAFSPTEWAILERKSRKEWRDRYGIADAYGSFPEGVQIEEGIAHAYADWRAGRSMDGIIAKAFKKIRGILQAIGKAFGKDFRTAEDVFGQVAIGEIGNRSRGDTQGEQAKFSIADPTGSKEFKRWFGDSKVVDASGKPLVVYHGTADEIDAFVDMTDGEDGFYFAASADTAQGYADMREGMLAEEYQGGQARVMSVYLSLQNPLVVDRGGKMFRDADNMDARDAAIAGGHDGIIYRNVIDEADTVLLIDHKPTDVYVAFRPEQIKSVNNRGTFDPADPNMRFKLRDPQTAEDRQKTMQGMIARGQPLDRALRMPFQFFGGVDEKGRWKPGLHLSDKAAKVITTAKIDPQGRFGWLAGPIEAARAGLIDRYGLSPEYIDRDRQRQMDERSITMRGAEVLKTLAEQNVGTNEARVLQAILTGEAVSDKDMNDLAAPSRRAIDELGQEAVSLGLVSAESFERNRGAYLHRVYAKHEAEQNNLQKLVSQVMGRKRKQIIGDELKGRGLFWDVDNARLMRDIASFKEGKRGGPVLGEKFRVLDNVLSPTKDMLSGEERGKVARRVYVPADQAVPAQYTGPEWRDNGVWEVRKAGKDKVTLWRDYSQAERSKMGEILDARYTIGKTYLYMAHDLATGRFYKDIAQNEDWTSSAEPADGTWTNPKTFGRAGGYGDFQWVRVPDEPIPSTGGKKKWGALAGKFVRTEIWRDLNEINVMNRPSTWHMLLSQWKLNHTARSPQTHMNNVMSNLMFMDMQDVRMQDLQAGIRSFINKDKHWQDANAHGVFGSDMMTQEIRDKVLKPILAEIEKQGQDGVQNSFLARAGILGKFADRLFGLAKTVDRKMIDLYRAEDDVFRLASYRAGIARGESPEHAAAAARERFLDYDIRAPWVNAARNSLLPFISYTYRAVPLIARAMATRPWKLAKYAMIAYALNALAYAWDDDGDEDKERASLNDQEQGNTWMGTPRMMRMPWRNKDGMPVFLDVRRWIPAGDVFDTNQGQSVIPIPAPLQFGGPMMLGAELALNKSAFTGDPIRNDLTDNWWDTTGKTADYLWKAWMPSAAWVPGSWYWTKIENAAKGATDSKGHPYSLPEAISSSFGVKVKPQDVETGLFWHYKDIKDVEQALRAEARTLARQRDRGLISQKAFDAGMQSLLDKRDRLVDRVKELQRATRKK